MFEQRISLMVLHIFRIEKIRSKAHDTVQSEHIHFMFLQISEALIVREVER